MKPWIVIGLLFLVPSLYGETKVEVKAGIFGVSATFEGADAEKFFRALGQKEVKSAGDSGTQGPTKLGDLITYTKHLENGDLEKRGRDEFTSLECTDEYFRKTGKRFRIHCEMHVTTPTPNDNKGYIVRAGKDGLAKKLFEAMEKDSEEKVVENQLGTPIWTERVLRTSDKKAVFLCTRAANKPAENPEAYQCFTTILTTEP